MKYAAAFGGLGVYTALTGGTIIPVLSIGALILMFYVQRA